MISTSFLLGVLLDCTLLPTPMDPAFCTQLDASGTINVMCPWNSATSSYAVGGTYANPNDDCDDTDAIQSALNRALQYKTIYLPVGIADVQPGYLARPYRVSAPLNITGRRVVGEHHMIVDRATRIVYAGATPLDGPDNLLPPPAGEFNAQYQSGSLLWSAGAVVQVENLLIDGAGLVDYGLYLYRSHGPITSVRNVKIKGTREAGLFLDSTMGATLDSIHTELNQKDGIVLVSATTTSIMRSSSTWNGRNGIVVVRRNGGASGGVTMLSCVVEQNGQNGIAGEGHGVYVLNTLSQTLVEKFWFEANFWDGFRAEGAHNVTLSNSNLSGAGLDPDAAGDSSNHAIHLSDSQHCTVRGNNTGGSAYNWQSIWVDGPCRFCTFTENIYDSGNGATEYLGGGQYFEVVYFNGTTKSRVGQHINKSVQSHAPPVAGAWAVGDIVWNRSPASGEPAGWMCAVTSGTAGQFSCTQWLTMGSLAP